MIRKIIFTTTIAAVFSLLGCSKSYASPNIPQECKNLMNSMDIKLSTEDENNDLGKQMQEVEKQIEEQFGSVDWSDLTDEELNFIKEQCITLTN